MSSKTKKILRLTDVDTASALNDLRKITSNQISLLKSASGARILDLKEIQSVEALARIVRLTEAQADAEEARTVAALGDLSPEERLRLATEATALLSSGGGQ